MENKEIQEVQNMQGPKARWSAAFKNDVKEGINETSSERLEAKGIKEQEQRNLEQQQQYPQRYKQKEAECLEGKRDSKSGTDIQKRPKQQGKEENRDIRPDQVSYCTQAVNSRNHVSQLSMNIGSKSSLKAITGPSSLATSRSSCALIPNTFTQQFNTQGQLDHSSAQEQNYNRYAFGQFDHNTRQENIRQYLRHLKHQQDGGNIRAAYHQQLQRLDAPRWALEFSHQTRKGDDIRPFAQSYPDGYVGKRSSNHNLLAHSFPNTRYPVFTGNDVNIQPVAQRPERRKIRTRHLLSVAPNVGHTSRVSLLQPKYAEKSSLNAGLERKKKDPPLQLKRTLPSTAEKGGTMMKGLSQEDLKSDSDAPLGRSSSDEELTKVSEHSQERNESQSMKTAFANGSGQSKTLAEWKGMGHSETYEKYEHFIQKQNTYIQEVVNDSQGTTTGAADTELVAKKVESKGNHTQMSSTYESTVTNRNMKTAQPAKCFPEKNITQGSKDGAEKKRTVGFSDKEDAEITNLETERMKEFNKWREEDMELEREQDDLLDKLLEVSKTQTVSQKSMMCGQMTQMFSLLKAVQNRMQIMTASQTQRRTSTAKISEVRQSSDQMHEIDIDTKDVAMKSTSCTKFRQKSSMSQSSTVTSSFKASSSTTETSSQLSVSSNDEFKSSSALNPFYNKEECKDIPMSIIPNSDECSVTDLTAAPEEDQTTAVNASDDQTLVSVVDKNFENNEKTEKENSPSNIDDLLGNVISQVFARKDPKSEKNGADHSPLETVPKTEPNILQAMQRFISVLNGAHSPHSSLNGRTPSPPAMGNSTSAQQLPPACGARQLSKLKRFLTTLQQFGSDISPEIGERVRSLVLGLVVRTLLIFPVYILDKIESLPIE